MTSRTHVAIARVGLVAIALSAAPDPAPAGELAAEGQVGYLGMAASRSAEALFDSSGGLTWGGAVRYTFYKSFFATAGVRTLSKEGERAFLVGPNDPVVRLGLPLSVRITPIFLTVGYRFCDGELVVPYAGLGGSITRYREDSTVAGLSLDESFSKAGFQVVGGVEVGRGRFRFGAEAGWSTVPSAIGVGGVSEVYGEDNIGGWSVIGKAIIAFGSPKPPAGPTDPEP